MIDPMIQIPWDMNYITKGIEGLNLKGASSSKEDPEDLKKVCQEFESLFTYYILKTMRESIPKSSLFGLRKAETLYQSMLDQQLARTMSSGGGIGIAKLLMKQFSQNSQKDGDQNPWITRSVSKYLQRFNF